MPFCSRWSANGNFRSGNAAEIAAWTASAWWPTTGATGEAPSSSARAIGYAQSGRFRTWCRTFALSDFIRVPLPAQSTIAARAVVMAR